VSARGARTDRRRNPAAKWLKRGRNPASANSIARVEIDTETLIIGASAAGLATAAALAKAGRSFEILEAADVVGNA
jgi:heterodisulfide reductase subunit A-like polyferredoxin